MPPGAEPVVARLGDAAFRKELTRDPRELTACILSALLTDRHEGFRATVGLADLTSFHLDLEENTPNTTIFALNDLKSFSATVGPGVSLTSLALDTLATQGPDPTSYPREFTISSLNPPDAETHVVILGFPLFWTSGTVTITAVTTPEPSSLTLALLGIGTVIVARSQSSRRKARADAACSSLPARDLEQSIGSAG